MGEDKKLYLGLDVSTKTIGISLFEETGKLVLLTHVTPKIKLDDLSPMEILIKKVEVFESEFLEKYADSNIIKVIIEEPLLQSNNVNTVATLLRFNGMICRSVYETLNVVPEFISSYDARKYAFPELMSIRATDKEGKILSEKELKKKTPVLFGGYPKNVDKKLVIWEKVADREPQIVWLYDKHQNLKKENFDMTDSYAATLGFMRKNGLWN
jgi:hypothetical protein